MSEDGGILVQFLLALAVVLLLIVALTWILKKINAVSSRVGLQGAQPRLSVTEALSVDHKRRLVLVKRDHVEHLLLIGGENDLLLEYGILPHPAQQARMQQTQTTQTPPAKPASQPAAATKTTPSQPQMPVSRQKADQSITQGSASGEAPKTDEATISPMQRARDGLKSSVGTVTNAGAAAASAGAAMLKSKTVPPGQAKPIGQSPDQHPATEAKSQPPLAPASWRPERPSETQKQNQPATVKAETEDHAIPSATPSAQTQSGDGPVSDTAGSSAIPAPNAPPQPAQETRRSGPDLPPLPIAEPAEKTQATTSVQDGPHTLPPLPPLTQPNEVESEAQKETGSKEAAPEEKPKPAAGVAYDEEINRLLNELSSGPKKS